MGGQRGIQSRVGVKLSRSEPRVVWLRSAYEGDALERAVSVASASGRVVAWRAAAVSDCTV